MGRTVSSILATGTVLLAICVGVTTQAGPALASPTGSIQVSAPERVEVGDPIKVTLSAESATGIGGYEASLLFDTDAAEFSAVTQDKKDLDDQGRDVGTLGPVHTPRGVSFGAFSCPVEECTRPGGGPETERGVRGAVELATATVIPRQPGGLEFRLDAIKLVDATGRPIASRLGNERFVVEVGAGQTDGLHAAPKAAPWTLKGASSPSGPVDLTGDGQVTNADAMEASIAWILLREDGVACGEDRVGRGKDINRDGCIDVADLQTIVARYDTNETENTSPTAPGETARASSPLLATILSITTWLAPRPALAQEASTFTVNSEVDQADASTGNGVCATTQGVCTLRAAIEESNLRPGPDTIAFSIPGTDVRTIQVGSPLPTINDETGPTTIDGYTQPGSSPNSDPLVSNAAIKVQIASAGTSLRDAMIVSSPGNTIRGIAFFKLRRPIWFYGPNADNNTVAGTFVGTDASGTFTAPAEVFPADGIRMQAGASGNTIGGTSVADRNVVSGNAYRGVATFGETSDFNRIVNNIIGLGPAGDKRLPNIKHGVDINGDSAHNQIGGTQQGERNLISGNGQEGVEISHEPLTRDNRVVGNFIGTDATGKAAPDYTRNDQWGVHIEDRVKDNIVRDNVIGNNRKGGIRAGNFVTGTVIENNRIGVSLDGTAIPNSPSGVTIGGGSTGSRVGPNNIIAHNGVGIQINDDRSDFNTVTGNSVFRNDRLGIDIAPLQTANVNDDGDLDSGPNEQLNFPVLAGATSQRVQGTACGGCTVEVFLADSGAQGFGEGRALVGSSVAGASGAFDMAVSGVVNGDVVTATATDAAGNTSEFSSNRTVSEDTTAPVPPTGLTATAAQGSVMLDWDDNAEPDVAGYSVYRSLGSGGPYTKINTSRVSTSTYADTKVTRGTTYHYVITAVDRVGNESGFSNEAKVSTNSVALLFDGSDDRVSIPSSNLLNATGTNQRTYEMKIRTGADVNGRQFVYEEGAGKGSGFSVEIADGRIYFNAWALGAGWDTVSASGPVSANTSYHVAGVYAQSSGTVSLYLDGKLQQTSLGAANMPSHSESGVLGGIQGSARSHTRTSVSAGGAHFAGLIDEFRVWKQARTPAQVEDGRSVDLSGTESGLILLYEVEEGSGNLLDDSSSSNLDGTVFGATWTNTT